MGRKQTVVFIAAALALATAILVGAPPSYRAWQLAGQHRFPLPDSKKRAALLNIK